MLELLQKKEEHCTKLTNATNIQNRSLLSDVRRDSKANEPNPQWPQAFRIIKRAIRKEPDISERHGGQNRAS